MPRIHTVAADGTITAGDKLIGSDGAENANFVTRNYTVGSIKNFILNGTHAGSFTTVTTSGNATIGGNLTVTGNATIAGNLTFGDADTDTVAFGADIVSNIIPDVTNTYNLGSSTKEWKDIHLANTARIGSILLNGANNEISGVTDIYAQKIYDSNDSTYFLDPSASISLKVKGNIQLGDPLAETNSEITSYGDLILKADADADDGKDIKFFSGTSQVASIDKDGKLTVESVVATGTIVANNTDTINGININNSNQEMSGIGEIYAHKFIDSQTGSHYVDPGHSLSAVFAGRIRMVVPTFANDSAAGTGGLATGDVYKTSAGDLKIKL
jgi:hypothetical protein|tara:strand:- start:269 stop:1252 length:984 start_codon:yes stop_codon:yes gene_type:complete